jgi:hypothetical protein
MPFCARSTSAPDDVRWSRYGRVCQRHMSDVARIRNAACLFGDLFLGQLGRRIAGYRARVLVVVVNVGSLGAEEFRGAGTSCSG